VFVEIGENPGGTVGAGMPSTLGINIPEFGRETTDEKPGGTDGAGIAFISAEENTRLLT
jgi:hypothetical protein